MNSRLLFSSALALALVSPVMAQDSAPAKPAMSASMPMDCKMAAQGGQGAMPMGKDMQDMPCAGASAPKTAKPKRPHDHAKFHKNQ